MISSAVAFAPGRVNLIGEHTDYNDGLVLPMALERGITVAARATDDGTLTVRALDLGEAGSVPLDALARERTKGWIAYVAGVADALQRSGARLPGAELQLRGDVPIGAGLSSSAALELATARSLVELTGGAWDPVAAARLCQRVENEFVGVPCGIMDQMTSACAVEGTALLIDCRSLEYRTVLLPAEVSVVVMDSGVRRRLASGENSEYAARRAACERAVAVLGKKDPRIRALRDAPLADLDAADGALDETDRNRARHVIDEIERVKSFVAAIERDDVVAAGRIIDASHESLRSLYEVSSDALDALVGRARAHPACLGARMTGAGFGGCAVALVRSGSAQEFVHAISDGFETPAFVARAGGGARLVPAP